ncbi:MAG: hypothetical protein CM15mP59_2170 [Flavobacteriaceae bacterium]|nr:MAG: hypothetical protein CM15mP59_2170 [Flavobacteriaceae bacterium]
MVLLARENKDNEIVAIPGLRGRDPKEITLKNLSKIIHARVTEIIESVYAEIKNYGHEEQKKNYCWYCFNRRWQSAQAPQTTR